jgi:hypothetical protein
LSTFTDSVLLRAELRLPFIALLAAGEAQVFGSAILDVAIGLVLVFLLISLILTAVREAIEGVLRSRAGDLNRAIFELLQQDRDALQKFYDHPIVFAMHRATADSRAGQVAHDTATKWKERLEARKLLPSYIPREVFSGALIDLFQSGAITNPALVKAFDTLNRVAGEDLGRLRGEVERWYDGTMDRASGWYKRRTHQILFWLGLGTALVLNVNALTIGNYLATSPEARAFATTYAQQFAEDNKPPAAKLEPADADTPSLDDVVANEIAAQGEGADPVAAAAGAPPPVALGGDKIKELYTGLQDTVGLPIGWSRPAVDKLVQNYPRLRWSGPVKGHLFEWAGDTMRGLLAMLALIAGYLVTAFAAMLGAPFWFDVLNRVMVIRSTVKPREKSPDEASEDRRR